MHLRNVELFCDVVARRSFSRAAEEHHVSQSSASQAVHLVEERLGTLLIDRSKRPLELTPAGQVYFDGCRKILGSFRRVEDRVRGMNNKVVGRLRVAAIYSVGLLQMDRYVHKFRDAFPDVDLRLEYLHPDDVYSRLAGDEADLGLVSFPKDTGETASIAWQEQPLVIVMPPRHRLAEQTSLYVADLDGEDFVSFTPELGIRRRIDRWLKKSHVAVHVVHEFDNIENIKRAVEIGSGIAVLPLPTVQRETEFGWLTAIAPADADWSRPLGIVYKKSKSLTSAASKLVELLLEEDFADSSDASSTQTANNAAKTIHIKHLAVNADRRSVAETAQRL